MQRNTVQRQIILDTLRKLRNHPSIDEIHSEIYSTHPSISKTTIYRNLRQLTKAGIVRQVSLPDGLERYDATIEKHHHFRCKKCNRVSDVDIEYSDVIDETVRQTHAFQIDEHDIVFSGICPKCKKK